MRSFLLAAICVAVVRCASINSPILWKEWPRDGMTTRTNVCVRTLTDGSTIQVCCEGYTGNVEEGCKTPFCRYPCLNGGTCDGPDECLCTDGFTGTTCQKISKNYQWSEWVNQDTSNSNGDSEELYNIRSFLDVCKNHVPQAIECQTSGGIDYTLTGQIVTCDRRLGLVCLNAEQPNGVCLDYEVRILCLDKEDESKKNVRTCVDYDSGLEYDPEERVSGGDCIASVCQPDGRWDRYADTEYCVTAISTTPAPIMPWLPNGVEAGQCIVGETAFNHGETTTLDCTICTCDGETGWSCERDTDPTCVASPHDDYCRVDDHFIFFHGQTANNDCNICICKNSDWDCTQTICPDKTGRSPYHHQCTHPRTKKRYDDGEILERDCNICVCTQGKWDCTQDTCEEGSVYEADYILSERKICNTQDGVPYPHGATITQDCNACKCFDGKWQCSRRYCSPETYPESLCLDVATASLVKSGQTIRRGCDICLCNGGNLTCTNKTCDINTGVCFDEQRRFTTSSSSFERQYRPVCHRDGTFSPIQCNSLHRVCFCVTPLGQVVPGSAVRQDSETPTCSPYITNVNVDPYQFTMPIPETNTDTLPCFRTPTETDSTLLGYVTPKCLTNGYFAPRQCDAHTGICYCVTSMGVTIPATVMHVSKGRPNCEGFKDETLVQTPMTTVQKTICQEEKEKADKLKLPFRPVCDINGNYRPLQVNPLTNVHFCVDINGVVIPRTITQEDSLHCDEFANFEQRVVKPYTSTVDNDRPPFTLHTFPVTDLIHITPRCDLHRRIAEHVPTVYQPQCETDGRYNVKQCPDNTDVCFCVDVTGVIVPETTARSGGRNLDCSMYRSTYVVQTKTNTSTVTIQPSVSLTHTRWDPALREVEQIENVVGPQSITINEPVVLKSNLTACIRQQQIATVVPGVFMPTCLNNGSFSTIQHHPLTNDVFCVDKNGVFIDGTSVRMDTSQIPDCTQYWNTTLNTTTVSKHWGSQPGVPITTNSVSLDKLFPAGLHHHPNCSKQQELTSRVDGAVVPTCEPNGTYTVLQCNATTGVCYCILPYGDVLPETVLPMVKGVPNCWQIRNATIFKPITAPVPEVCKLSVITGPCKARFIRWAFSTLLNKCQLFVYGGCRGNENNFKSKKECENTCGHLTPLTDSRPLTCYGKLSDFNRMSFVDRMTVRRPDCTTDGFFKPKQCYYSRSQTGLIVELCDCVDTITGEPVETCVDDLPTDIDEQALVQTTPASSLMVEGCMVNGLEYHHRDVFYDECNECMCIGNNQATCTVKGCRQWACYHEGVEASDYIQGCDECKCIGGVWDCTRNPNCDTQEVLDTEIGTATHCVVDGTRTILVGEVYYEDCNKCICTNTGDMSCDTKYCIPRHCYDLGTSYHNHEVISKDCNKCTCFGGEWECQDYVCDPIIKTMVRLEGCQFNNVNYKNGEEFYASCNLCECLGNNATSCLTKACNPNNCYLNGTEILAGTTTVNSCTTCTCFNGGYLSCENTRNCETTGPSPTKPVPLPTESGVNMDPSITCEFERKTYINGQNFWKGCNPCRCYDNGQVLCETKDCPSSLCYEEGIPYPAGKVLYTETDKLTCFRGGSWSRVPKTRVTGPPDMIDCPPERPPVFCKTNPCDSTVCPNYPEEAFCVPKYCGGCSPAFFDRHGNRLNC